jgi:hypothetical protein
MVLFYLFMICLLFKAINNTVGSSDYIAAVNGV